MVPFLPQSFRLCRVLKTPRQKPIRLTRSPTRAPRKRLHQPIREAKAPSAHQIKANRPTRKAKVCASKKGKPSHNKGQSMCQKKGHAVPQERPKHVPEEKDKPPHKKGHSMCQQKGPTSPQERPQYVPAKMANYPTREAKVCVRANINAAHKKG
ncbi:hypothetical protein F4703DRAFT_1790396 [Phycomyces blakesleeanus]